METREQIINASSKRLNSLTEVTEADLIAHMKLVYPNGKPEKMSEAEWEARHKHYSNKKQNWGLDAEVLEPKHTCPMLQDVMCEWIMSKAGTATPFAVNEQAYDHATPEDRERLEKIIEANGKALVAFPNPSLIQHDNNQSKEAA